MKKDAVHYGPSGLTMEEISVSIKEQTKRGLIFQCQNGAIFSIITLVVNKLKSNE